jgi:hypothetical protein
MTTTANFVWVLWTVRNSCYEMLTSTQIMASSSNKNRPLLRSSSFQSLPYELREQIWLESLAPRLIYLYPHHIVSSLPSSSQRPKSSHYKLTRTDVGFGASIHGTSNTPAQAFAAYESFVALKAGADGEMLEPELKQVGRHPIFRNPNSPPALRVCHESRAIALNRGYVLAFKDASMVWKEKEPLKEREKIQFQLDKTFGRKGIWVDFDHDLFMFYTGYKRSACPHYVNRPLTFLHNWAPDDAKRIKRLALHGQSDMVLKALRADHVAIPHGQRWRTTWQWVSLGFDNLQEIWIDDEVEPENNSELYYDTRGNLRDWQPQKDAAEQFSSSMVVEKSLLPSWTAPLPQVKVVRGAEWDTYFGD